jgi:hypothetical protein
VRPRSKFMAFVIPTLITVGILPAQPDPVLSCRRRASDFANTVLADTSAQRRGGLSNGNDMVLWKAKLSNGHNITGFCEVSPQTGRVVRLGADQDSGDVNRAYRMTPGDAEKICAREARARFSPGNGMIDAVFQPNSSSKSIYRVGWRWDSMAGAVRKGRCEIDSATGQVRGFHANLGW